LGIFFLNCSQLLDHIRTHTTVFLTPAVIGCVGYLDFLAEFRDGFALAQQPVCFPEFRYDLGATVLLFHEFNLSLIDKHYQNYRLNSHLNWISFWGAGHNAKNF